MIIEVSEVPDETLDALLEAAPGSVVHPFKACSLREEWREALAAALTEWEKTRPRDVVPPVYAATAHECTWRTVAVQHRDAILGIKQTDVLQRCDGCGAVQAPTFNGAWTLEQLRG